MKLKHAFLFSLITSMFFISISCERGDTADPQPVRVENENIKINDGMLIFKDAEIFSNTVSRVCSMDEQQLKAWLETFHNFISLSTLEGTDTLLVPRAYTVLFNNKYLLQIGKEVVYLHNGSLYAVESGNEDTLNNLIMSLSRGEVVDNMEGVVVHKIERTEIPVTVGQDLNGARWGDARYQKEFVGPTGVRFKIVFGASTYKNFYSQSIVQVAIKLEYYKKTWYGGQWRGAGEKTYKGVTDLQILKKVDGINYLIKSWYSNYQNYSGNMYLEAVVSGECPIISVTADNIFANVTEPSWPYSSYFGSDYVLFGGQYYYTVRNASWPEAYLCN